MKQTSVSTSYLRTQSPGSGKKNLRACAAFLSVAVSVLSGQQLQATDSVVVGSIRVQCLSDSLARLEVVGQAGFEDRQTFHVVNRDWPGAACSSNLVSGEIQISTAKYVVHVPAGATSLNGVSITGPSGQTLFQGGGSLNNSVWLPAPSENPVAWSFADTPRLVPPAWGITPAPNGSPNASTSGWVTNNDAADVYVFLPNGSYSQLRKDFLKLTGPTEMVPLYALGAFDSRWFDYSEETALAEIDANRSRRIPVDVLVCDTGWRVSASTGYQPNPDLFPDLSRFFSEAHAKNVRVMFNDHPEPVGNSALDPNEVMYRYTNVAGITGSGLDVWWYDRNWGVSLFSPAPNLRKEVWGMKIYNDAAVRTNSGLRPLIMANADGIDNGIRNRPPNVAAHRYAIQWTGDTGPSLSYLNYGVQNAVHAGVHWTYPYLSEDLGGHVADPSPGDYLRWIEYGALSPIFRPHCTHNLTRMPWTFGSQAEWVARRYLNMRYRLLPEFYAAAHENYETGEPILRRLDLDYPQYTEASRNSQYLITHSLLVAPVTSGGLNTVPAAWLTTTNGQAGLLGEYFNNETLDGVPALTRTDSNIDFNWGTGTPGGSVNTDHFSVRWSGNINVPTEVGDITLAATSDDGVRVWLDNQLCIGNWGANNSVATESTVWINAGQIHSLRVEFLELSGNAIVSLKWRPQSVAQNVWIPPGNWINAWSGAVITGPTIDICKAPLDQIPLYIRSGSIFALAPEMQHTDERPWDQVTLDVYPSTTETDRTTLYEDDKLTTAYKQAQFRTSTIKTWANDSAKSVSVSIEPAVGSFNGALSERSWTVRFRRPPGWTTDLSPSVVTVNGQQVGSVVRRIRNLTAMPLGSNVGAPDADVFDVTIPAGSVLSSNLIVATFASDPSVWSSRAVGNVGTSGNAVEGGACLSNSVCILRGAGSGIGGTNDGFQFLYQPCVGDVQLTARLWNQQSTNANAAAGIMISESLQASSRNAVLLLRPDNTGVFQRRSTVGTAAQTTLGTGLNSPRWLRLSRSGSTVSSYTSSDGATWNLLGSASISGFSSNAYIGLVVTANFAVSSAADGTNGFGTVITGVSSGMMGGVYTSDDTNCNLATFSNLTLQTPLRLSSIPNQTLQADATAPAIGFVVTSTNGGPLTFAVQSSNPDVLPVANIHLSGSGTNRAVTLTSTRVSGSTAVILTASDGSSSVSTEFAVTVLPFQGELLRETFSNYSLGNMGGQAYRGTGFPSGAWSGLNSSFSGNVPDAAQFSQPSLATTVIPTSGGRVTVKGDGSNLRGLPDLSAGGAFASANLLDSISGTVGGGNVQGTLYVSFLLRSVASNHDGEYGGLHLSRGSDNTGVLIGNAWNALAFSLDYTPTSTEVDLRNYNGTGDYLFVDNAVHLLVAKIVYAAGGDDTITIWLDPDPSRPETSQNSLSTYVASVSGDLSFDRMFLRGGNNNPFEYDEIRLGTTWNSVLSISDSAPVSAPVLTTSAFLWDNNVCFSFQGSSGLRYSILTSSNLWPDTWQVLASGTFGFEAVQFSEALALNQPQRFYRISIP